MASRVGLVVVLLSALVSCNSGKPDNDADASVEDDAAKVDGPFEAIQAPTCSGESGTICQDLEVHRCIGGRVSDELVDTCLEACSLGRCTSEVCAKAEQSDGMRGCRFYAVQVDNVDQNDSASMMLLVTNASGSPAQVTVEARLAEEGWVEVASDLVGSPAGRRFEVNRPAREAGKIPSAAFRITSDRPIVVAQIVSDDADRDSISTGGTVLLPLQTLGHRYFAVTYPGGGTGSAADSLGSRGGAGMIVIVGTEQGSNVIVRPTAAIDVGDGSVVVPGDEFNAGLNEGDVVQLFAIDPSADLTGTHIESGSPIAVLSGNIFTTYGNPITGYNGADLAIEQVPPYEIWGQEYVGTWHAPQMGCDSFWGTGMGPSVVGAWQVIAASDNTLVTLEGSKGTLFSMNGQPFDGRIKLDRGQSRRFFALPDPALTAPGIVPLPTDFVARANHLHGILLAQWMDCEPALSFGIDTRFGDGDTAMVLPPGFDQEVLVVRPAGAPMKVDQMVFADAFFGPKFGSGEFQVARLTLGAGDKKAGPCASTEDRCFHTITGDKFGVSWRGMDIACSFALTFPPGNLCSLSSAQCSSE